MDERLKPCPFCGSEARINSAIRWVKPRWNKRKARGVYYFIGCTDPECILYNDAKCKQARLMFQSRAMDLLVRRWNRRVNNDKG